MKELATNLDVPVLVTTQLAGRLERRRDKRPRLTDLPDSDIVERAADLVLFLYRDVVYHPDTPDEGIAEVTIAKNGDGRLGTVRLQFIEGVVRFETVDERF